MAEMGRLQGSLDGEVMPRLVVGATGRRFRGREVVSFRHPPGLFGTRATGRERVREGTVANGLLNQCAITDHPTPYWAVMDAMCSLKSGFTKRQAIDAAVGHVGEGKRRACEIAWDVLRNHHRHERKRDAGMGFMVDTLEGGRMAVRARAPGETLAYFAAERGRREAAEAVLAGDGQGGAQDGG